MIRNGNVNSTFCIVWWIAIQDNVTFFYCSKLTKMKHDTVIIEHDLLSHAWHNVYKLSTNGKRISLSLIIINIYSFRLNDRRTIALWIWLYRYVNYWQQHYICQLFIFDIALFSDALRKLWLHILYKWGVIVINNAYAL